MVDSATRAEVPSIAVLSVGYDLPELLAGAPAVHVFPEALTRDDLDSATETIDAALRRSGHALVVYPEWLREPTLRRLETIRAALATDRLALHGSALPPLAGGVLCNLASALTAQLTRPGQLVAALGDLERELIVVSWLGTVTGLKQPSPSVWQHVGSLSPRSSYRVVLQPEPAVQRVGRTGDDLPLQTAQRPLELVVAAREGADASWLDDAVNAGLGDLKTRTVPATRHGPDWWGTARLAEAVAYPTGLPELARDLAIRHRLRLCGWCSQPIASTPCPFCRGTEQPADAPAGGVRSTAV
jgi:hypothetical protein